MKNTKLRYEFFDRPGRYWSDEEVKHYVSILRDVASECFDEIPDYQCLTGKREELSRVVIMLAKNKDARVVAFCSSLFIDQDILHLGLTCVRPEARSGGLTHKLLSKLIIQYMLKNKIWSKLWVTNCACVISSLGNIALNFDQVYPSPFAKKPGQRHLEIAELISREYRVPIAIADTAEFDKEKFIFRGSVKGTTFQKDPEDKRYHHREAFLTEFYKNSMDFENGDEVLQVANLSLFSFPKYIVKQFTRKIKPKTNKSNAKSAQQTAA
ncbi:MAG: hypothetical protein JNM93_08275 [Bacteriovoracaceae bacterium]|nr:hypothetical protein [Bacteriovoracaceae bacterium]